MTSVEQGKAAEAVEMKSHATHFIHQDHYLVLNKCLEEEMKDWFPTESNLSKLKVSLEEREKNLKLRLKKDFTTILEFPEIMSKDPLDHVELLTQSWKKYVS